MLNLHVTTWLLHTDIETQLWWTNVTWFCAQSFGHLGSRTTTIQNWNSYKNLLNLWLRKCFCARLCSRILTAATLFESVTVFQNKRTMFVVSLRDDSSLVWFFPLRFIVLLSLCSLVPVRETKPFNDVESCLLQEEICGGRGYTGEPPWIFTKSTTFVDCLHNGFGSKTV